MPSNSKNTLETVSVDSALAAINSLNGLVKTVCSPLNENIAWNKILAQLADPKYNRPVKKIDENEIDRSRAYHPKLNIWESKILKVLRGAPKDTIFTKKTSTTLLPLDGKIHLFKPILPKYQDTVGMLFDLRQCDLKNEKYIFPNNVNSNKKWWLKRKKLTEAEHPVVKGIALNQLRASLTETRKNGAVPQHNELLVGLSKESLVGLFATKNELFARLNTLAKQQLIKRELKKLVPLFIITPEEGVINYDEKLQLRDLQIVLKRDENDPLRKMVEKDIDKDLLAQALHNLPKNKHILTSECIPPEVKSKIIDYFDLNDLTNYTLATPSINDQLKNLFLAKRNHDYKKLCAELKEPLTKELLQKMIMVEPNEYTLIKRAIFHFCNRNPQQVEEIFVAYLRTNKNPNPQIIVDFLNYTPKIKVTHYSKNIVSVASEEGPWGEHSSGIEIDVNGWSFLVAASLYGNTEIVKLIIEKYPEQLENIMNVLTKLENICATYPNDAIYSTNQVMSAKENILLQLKPEHDKYYQLNYADKRLIQKHLKCEINKLSQKSAIENFYNKTSSMLYFNQHRHAYYDTLTNKRFSKLQKNIFKTLQKKSFSMHDDDRKPMNEEEQTLFNSIKLELKLFLENKKKALESEKSNLKYLFYIIHDTFLKTFHLQKAIQNLDKVITLIDLRLFTENLLTNKYLVDSRTLISFTKSNTYSTLDTFYQNHFTKKM